MKTRLLALSALFVGTAASANDNPVVTAINDAVAAGQANYGLVVVGLIGLAAIGFGLSSITSAMRG